MFKRRAVFAVWLVLGAGLPPALAADTPAVRTADEWAAVASQRLKDGDRDAAIEALQAAVKTDPAHGSAGLLITTLHQAGRIEEAYTLGERYRREGPRNPRALFRYGWLLAFIGEVERAVAARMPTLPLYGAPDPRDGMYASLVGAPGYEALLTRSRDAVDAERQRLGLTPLRREGK